MHFGRTSRCSGLAVLLRKVQCVLICVRRGTSLTEAFAVILGPDSSAFYSAWPTGIASKCVLSLKMLNVNSCLPTMLLNISTFLFWLKLKLKVCDWAAFYHMFSYLAYLEFWHIMALLSAKDVILVYARTRFVCYSRDFRSKFSIVVGMFRVLIWTKTPAAVSEACHFP
jgi:hypothetical protein